MEERYKYDHPLTHHLSIDNREEMEVNGVINVESFDDQEVIMGTEQGLLAVKGEKLHINHLNLDQGEVKITGWILELAYSDQKGTAREQGRSFLERIFK